MIRKLFLAALLLGTTAYAETDVPVPPFTGITAQAGADVKLIYGPKERVTVIKGDLSDGNIEVKDGHTLEIRGCKSLCVFHKTLVVEVVTPQIESVVAHSGAEVRASGNFPTQPHLSVQAHSGGDVDVMAIPADAVDAEAHSGGDAHVKVISSLNAKAHSGGDVTYSGHPTHLNSQTNSGGGIRAED